MLLFVCVFVIAPLIELYGIIQVSHTTGVLGALGLLILGAVVGSWLVKHEGLRVFRRFLEQIAANHVPSNEIADGVVIAVAGGLFIAPGFISDIVAMLLLIPPVRRAAGRYLVRRYTAKGGRSRIIRATYSGPIDVTSHEAGAPGGSNRPRRQIPPHPLSGSDDDEPA